MKKRTLKDIKKYCETYIIPKYASLDLAHKPDHVKEVIVKSFEIAKDYDVDLDMVYVVSVFHDLGLTIDRKMHHIEGGRLLINDAFIQTHFTKEEITTMQHAVEDHRASNKVEPRSIYGKIISEADRLIDPKTVILRCIQFQLSRTKNYSFEVIYPEVKSHLKDKYGHGGYLKLWLTTKENEKQLSRLRDIIDHEDELKKISKRIYRKLTKSIG